MTTPEQLQEALEKAQRALSAIESGPWSDSPRIATDALSEIAAILNPPRYVVKEGTAEQTVRFGLSHIVTDRKGIDPAIHFYDEAHATHIANLLNGEGK